MAQLHRMGAFAGMAAALSMAATPAAAADIPVAAPVSAAIPTPAVFDADAANVERHRYYRYRPYYRGHHRHHRRGIDAGDVFAGILILGGIAAVASAANKNKRDRDYRNRDYRYRDRDYRDRDTNYRERRGDSRYDGGRGIDNAVSMCVDRIERDVRVDSVDSVDRNGEGWRVTGALYNGERFTCRIGSDGRIDGVDYGAGFSSVEPGAAPSAQPAEGQWDDARYETARRNTATSGPARAVNAEQLPAYPGGPLPGEETAQAGGDDRYRTAEAPDFTG